MIRGQTMTFALIIAFLGKCFLPFSYINFDEINLVIVQVVIKYLFCYYQFNSSGTLFVLLDIDKDILDWLSQLDSKELSNCSWLLVVPANATSMPLTSINDNINSTQKSVISKLFSPFKSMTSKLPFKREWVGIREFFLSK